MSSTDDNPSSRAETLFAEFLGCLRRGEDVDLDALCNDNPGQAADLRRLKAAHDALYEKLLNARPQAEDAPRVSLLERLLQDFGSDVDPGPSIQEGASGDSAFAKEIVARLALRSGSFGRYTVEKEIAKGGMGTVLRVWDEDLRRWLAMKLIRARRMDGPAPAGAVDSRTLGRFVEEAQVTGQLDHPGIVPVHEMGLDAEGRVYFTMKLVEGRTLQAIFDELARGERGWTQTRVLGLLLRVCEAMSYAHAKGVIHRDLKPANVMVGRYGEVYVMDWGLARVLGREDRKDIRLRSPEPARTGLASPSVESPLLTMDGDVMGTPAYMPPEQARGEVDRLDERADVYSMGAMIYQLLTGRTPYARPGEEARGHVLLARVLQGPPPPLEGLAAQVPDELKAICEKAMAREANDRYADMSVLASDLSAFIEGRVVSAYEAGAWSEARKWILRNKPLAATLAAAVILALGGLGGVSYVQARGRALADKERRRANAEATEAQTQRAIAEAETAKVLRLSDVKRLQELEAEADRLWPPHREQIPAMLSWLDRADSLVSNLADHRATMMDMRDRALPVSQDGPTGVAATAGPTESELSAALRFESAEDQWQYELLGELMSGMKSLEAGLAANDAITEAHGWSIPRRLAFARELEVGFGPDGEYARAWSDALPGIREAYPGLDLSPQMGLVPIGRDPTSGLWEFAHLIAGEPPTRNAAGELILTEETGIVLVLLPGGNFWMGAQKGAPRGRNYDPQAEPDEGPVREVTLGAFFLSKYEMTQSQWLRLTGSDPSANQSNSLAPSRLHPVEQVSWSDCIEVLWRTGLTLPTQAQWEYGARGGTETPWWTGTERESLRDRNAANLADQSAARAGATWPEIQDWPDLDDGYAAHAPIGTYAANPFGLHEVLGNLWEWCLSQDLSDDVAHQPGPIAEPQYGVASQAFRGGGFSSHANVARCTARVVAAPSLAGSRLGVRPAMPIVR